MPIEFDKTPNSIEKLKKRKVRVRMLMTKGEYEVGKVYEVTQDLARVWLNRRHAEEDKMIDGPPEIKQ